MSANQHIRKTSKAGLAAIVLREGVRLTAYPDPATGGIPYTIGVGHTGGVRKGQRITLVQAYRFLTQDVWGVEVALNRLDVPAQRMYDSLASLGFNLGAGIFEPSHTIGKHLHARHWDRAAAAILLYDVAAGRHNAGLANRRRSERRQYLRGLAAYKRRLKRERA